MKTYFFLSLIFLVMLGCKSGPETIEKANEVGQELAAVGTASLDEAIASPARTEAERARDKYRNPGETLRFFDVKPTDKVLELWSGGGWYTHILAPYLEGQGKLVATIHPLNSEKEYRRNASIEMLSYVKAFKNTTTLETQGTSFSVEDAGTYDVVLTFRNVHNWVKDGFDGAVYAESFKALKSGGIFGVVEHRGRAGMTIEESAKSGYMDEEKVIGDIEAAGFKLVARSEINANAADTKDHPMGVWTLLPRMKLGETDREKYLSIGESDRMTLKFVKP